MVDKYDAAQRERSRIGSCEVAPEYVAGKIFDAAKGKKKTGHLFEVYP